LTNPKIRVSAKLDDAQEVLDKVAAVGGERKASFKLGSDMGYEVWVAPNDRGRAWQGKPFVSIRGLRDHLPRQLDEGTSKRTTSIHSGLLRTNKRQQPHAATNK